MDLRDIELKLMTEQDIAEAVRLISTAMNPDEGRWAEKTMLFHFGCLNNGLQDGRDYFVWRNDGRILGIVGLHHYIWGPEDTVWLAWFAVHPDWQRKGAGAKLMRSIEAIAFEMGYRKLFIETYRNPGFTKARKFYCSHGFKDVGGIRDYLPDGSDMVVYRKNLGEE